MADITTNLGTTTDTRKQPLPSSVEETSTVEILASASGRAVEAAEEFARNRRIAENRREAQAASAAKAAKDKAVTTGTTIAELARSTPGSITVDDKDELGKLGVTLATAREARAQGSLSQAAYDARVFQIEQTIRAKYGDETFNEYREALRTSGADKTVLQGFEQQSDQMSKEFKDILDANSKAFDAGIEIGLDPNTMSRAEITAVGRRRLEADTKFELAKREIEFVKAQKEVNELDRKASLEQSYTSALDAWDDAAGNNIDVALNMALKAIPAGLGDDATKAFLLQQIPQLRAGFDAFMLESRRQLEAANIPSDKIEARLKPRAEIFERSIKMIEEAPDVMAKQLKIMETRYGLNAAQSMPILTSMSSLLGKPNVLALLERGDPKLVNGLIKEVNEKMGNLDQNTSSFAHFGRMSMVLKGQIERTNLPPEQSKAVLQDVVRIVPTMASTLANDKGDIDDVTLTTTKNGIGEVSLAATRANPATGLSDIKALFPALASPDIRRAIDAGVKRGGADWKEIAVANKVGTANILQMLTSGPEGSTIKYNRATGRYESTFRERPNTVGVNSLINKLDAFKGTGANSQERARLANQALDHLVSFDSILPEQKIGTPAEERAFFATGEIPKSMRNTGADGKPDTGVAEAITNLLTTFRKGPGMLSKSTEERSSRRGRPVDISEVKGGSQKVLANIRRLESGGDYTAQNPNSTASGAYQFIDDTWKTLTKRYGVGTEYAKAKLAPAAIQDEIAEKYLADILEEADGDVSKVPVAWYTGNIRGNSKDVGPQEVSSYQSKWLRQLGFGD